MRENWAIIIAVLLVFAVVGIAYHAGIQDGRRGMYPDTAIIVGLHRDADLVTVCDVGGIVRQFFGCEDYSVGDLVRMLMWDAGTPHNCLDDEIVLAWYAGTLEQFGMLQSQASYQGN